MKRFYEEKILPHCIDLACASKQMRRQREKVVPEATGDVLEIGFGSGRNLPYFDRGKVRRIYGLEPSQGMRQKAMPAVIESALEGEFIDLPGEEIPLPDRSVDTVLVTFTLCTIPDAVAALKGMRRVLKPGGRLLYAEHGRAPDAGVRRWRTRLNPAWRSLAGGCHLDRDIPSLIEAAGFSIKSDRRRYIPGIRLLSYHYWGYAVARN